MLILIDHKGVKSGTKLSSLTSGLQFLVELNATFTVFINTDPSIQVGVCFQGLDFEQQVASNTVLPGSFYLYGAFLSLPHSRGTRA